MRNIAIKLGPKDWVKGQERLSFTEYNGEDEKPFIYMTKGNIDPSYLKGWTQTDADKWRSKWIAPADYTKTPTDVAMYNYVFDGETEEKDYEEWMKSIDTSKHYDVNLVKFLWLKHYVRIMIFNKNHSIWNIKAINLYKMCVYTYCFRNGIEIPNRDPIFKSYD